MKALMSAGKPNNSNNPNIPDNPNNTKIPNNPNNANNPNNPNNANFLITLTTQIS